MNAAIVLAIALSTPGAEVTESSGTGCSLLLTFDAPVPVDAPGGGWYMEIPGVPLLFAPGQVVIPAERLYIPVPPGAEPGMEFSIRTGLSGNIPGGRPYRTPGLAGSGLETVEVPVEPVGGPDATVEYRGVIPLAGSQYAVLDVFPWLEGSPGVFSSTVRIEMSWAPSRQRPSDPSGPARLVCSLDLPWWPAEGSRTVAESPFWGLPWARLAIGEGGGYEVTCDELEQAGCSITGTPSSSLRLLTGPGDMFLAAPADSQQPREVAIEVLDGGDGVFGSGDRIRFVALALGRWEPAGGGSVWTSHRYASHNVYWLTWGGVQGRRVSGRPSSPDASPQWGATITSDVRLEEENYWMPEIETSTGWVWAMLSPGQEADAAYSLPGLSGSAGCDIVAQFCTDTSGSWTAQLWQGSVMLCEEAGYGAGQHELEAWNVQIPSSGTLTFRSVSSSSQSLAFDCIHVSYPMQLSAAGGTELRPGVDAQGRFNFSVGGCPDGASIYDFTSHFDPVLLSGVQYSGSTASFSATVTDSTRIVSVPPGGWMTPDTIASAAPGRLIGTSAGADRLVVVPEILLDAVWGLLSVYPPRGITTEVATTREIYDEFGCGLTDPGAIRSAVRWAMDREGTAARGVMLVGDGHYDILGNSTSNPSLIPPYNALGASDPCFDDFYVMVHDGAVLPEIPISRIPVDSRSELLAFTAKLLACESGAWAGTWLDRAVLIADDEWGGYSQNESIHTISAEAIAEEVIPGSVERVKFYLIEYPWPVGENHPEKPEAREALVRLLSEGAAYTVYFGHGSAGQITHEKIFLPEDVDRLSNGRRLPLSVWATCDVGRFDSPVEDAIGEALVLHPAGGSIASVAATRGTFGESNYALARCFTDSLYNGPPVGTGEALWRAKLVNGETYGYNNRYYILFGDLDMQLQRPDGPVSLSVAGDTIRTGEANPVEGDCEVQSGLTLVELRESSSYVDYTCLGGALITYLRYGGVAFRGSAALEGGHFGLDCFVPVQCVTGGFGRAQGAVPGSSEFVAGALDPVEVATGDPAGGDDEGPGVEMWVEGYEGVEDPVVTGEIVLSARLTDPSGICFLGGSGRQLTLFVDGQGTDVGDWFSYLQGSSTEGMLSYPVGSLSQGPHSMILWSIDGLGNSSMDTLEVTASAPGAMRISELVAYPSPSDGPMCFSFRVSEDAFVSIGIHTVAGRCIRRLSAACTQGYNQILWDGLDEDGDPLASGAYPFSVRALATGFSIFESEAVETGVLAVIRE